MKTFRLVTLLLLPALLLPACSEPDSHSAEYKEYVAKAIAIMDANGLYAQGANWTIAKRDALEVEPGSEAEAQEAVRKALRVAGGRHSRLLTDGEEAPGSGHGQFVLPTVSVTDNGAWLITLPPFDGTLEQATQYAKAVTDLLLPSVPAVIIDLQHAQGENPYPMLAAVHQLLPEGTVLRVRSRNGNAMLSAESIVSQVPGIAQGEHIHCPVALLTGTGTRGAGEAVALSFTGHYNYRRFGTRTAGYAAVNQAYAFAQGAQLWLTTGNYVTTSNVEMGENPIEPSIRTATPLVTATQWIEEIFPSKPYCKTYVAKAVDYMDQYGLYAVGSEWQAAKQEALGAEPATLDEAHAIVSKALTVAGGKHSGLRTAQQQKELDENGYSQKPTVTKTDDGIAVILLPAFRGSSEQALDYARSVLTALPRQATGAVVDLRGNRGGNMYPMLAAVHQLLPDGMLLAFNNRNGLNWITRNYVLSNVGLTASSSITCPVAVLTDQSTASAAEATMIAFRGLSYARSFGQPTAGYASGNITFTLPDGARMVLTIGQDVARTGEVFCEDPVEPDVVTDRPLDEAVAWIKQQHSH